MQVGEQIFFQVLESMRANDFDNLDVKSQAIATSIATIVKVGITFIHTFDGRAF